MSDKAFKILVLAILLTLSMLLIYRGLERQSVDLDESIHIRVSLNILESDSWIPTYKDWVYIAKPPLNIFSNAFFVKLTNDYSLHGFRFLSVVYAFLTSLVIFFFSRKIFSSKIAILIASISIFASPVFIFSHMARNATQDSALLFYTTLSLLAFNQYYREGQDKKKFYLSLGIITCVIASLIKSVAGLLPVLSLIAYELLIVRKYNYSDLLRQFWILVLSILPLSLFYLYFFYFYPETYQSFVSEIPSRFTEGYHNSGEALFYFIELFRSQYGLPIFFVLGLIISLLVYRKRFSFIVFSFFFLLVSLSFLDSKLTWYMAITFPLIAVITAVSFEGKNKLRNLLLVLFVANFSYNIYINQIQHPAKKHAKINQVIDHILEQYKEGQRVSVYLGPENKFNKRRKQVLSQFADGMQVKKVKDLSQVDFSKKLLYVSGHEVQDQRLKRFFSDDQTKRKNKIYYYSN